MQWATNDKKKFYDITVDGNGCSTKHNRSMVEYVDDIVVCDQ